MLWKGSGGGFFASTPFDLIRVISHNLSHQRPSQMSGKCFLQLWAYCQNDCINTCHDSHDTCLCNSVTWCFRSHIHLLSHSALARIQIHRGFSPVVEIDTEVTMEWTWTWRRRLTRGWRKIEVGKCHFDAIFDWINPD